MKKIILNIITILCISLLASSCESLFDNLEGDLTKMSGSDMASSDAGLQRMLAQVYSYLPINVFENATDFGSSQVEDQYTMNAVDSHGGDYGFNNEAYYGMNGIKTFWNWQGIRSINSFIATTSAAAESGVIDQATADIYIAEARFVRAYCYFAMVRSYGGVPIITEVLDQYYDGGENAELFNFATRATEKDTWDFILSELDAAASALPETPVTEFRANKYSALGLTARVALYAASVSKYWGRQGTMGTNYSAVASKKVYMEPGYANAYYSKCITACEQIIGSGKFSLFGAKPKDVKEAITNLGEMFLTKQNCEYLFGVSKDDGISSGSNFDIYNSPAQTVTGAQACGRYSVALDLVDEYDDYDDSFFAVDGTVKTRTDGKENEYMPTPIKNFATQYASVPFIEYDNVDDPFKNKDARFHAWILYPDCTFRNQTIKIQGGLIKPNGTTAFWVDDHVEIDGQTYYSFGAPAGAVSGFYNYTQTNTGNTYTTGFGLRKFLNASAPQLYIKSFWYDIRYAEILLSYCEAVVESGANDKLASAKTYLNAIRHRAAFKDDVDPTLENVLHQRRLELAFENDLLYTMHRRRAFYNQTTDPASEGRRHELTPVLDLRSGKPKYVFVRAIFFQEDVGGASPSFHTNYLNYYKKMPAFGVNKYEPNPLDE
ncbi:MAG: RagB/SusD family nutrient uptake outer membrane protein [Bacteroidales bacterium]|jgi:hypothetical protein|nr:RagB/SusD family nutrient uptake outer membrane protein [Bacteroidales bacterium]